MGNPSMALVAWDRVVLPKLFGGINCGNLLHRNISLMFKWIWRFLNELDALWRNVIHLKYGYSPRLVAHELSIPTKGGPWRNICVSLLKHPTINEMLKSNIRRAVGNGLHIMFWQEVWLGHAALKNRFPRLYSITLNRHATISSLGYWSGPDWYWNFSWKRSFRPWDSLQSLLSNVCLSTHIEDSYVWTPAKSGNFSVKYLSFELAKSSACLLQQPVCNWRKLWQGLIPPRVEVFTRMALLGKINTRSKLAQLNIISPAENICALCHSPAETPEHLLLHCSFAYKLWSWWLGIWGLHWVFPSNLPNAFDQWVYIGKNGLFKKIWVAIFPIILWSLWKERNTRIFSNSSCNANQMQELVIVRLSWWIKGWGIPFPYSTEEILRNPSCLS